MGQTDLIDLPAPLLRENTVHGRWSETTFTADLLQWMFTLLFRSHDRSTFTANDNLKLSIVATHGKPDLFITFTCNTRWKEFTENLLPGQLVSDRPDIVARVFQMNFPELLNVITKRHIFGVIVADLHAIEFQKCGLPHTHMLFIFQSIDKVHNSSDIDNIVCGEIPDEGNEPELFYTIQSWMSHGPCGVLNPKSARMVDGTCICSVLMLYLVGLCYI